MKPASYQTLMRWLNSVLVTLWLAGSATASNFTGPVIGVLDGDKIKDQVVAKQK